MRQNPTTPQPSVPPLMSDSPDNPLPPGAAGLGCGVMAGASAVSLMFFSSGLLMPVATEAVGLDLSGNRWTVASTVVGVLIALVVGLASARALKQMP